MNKKLTTKTISYVASFFLATNLYSNDSVSNIAITSPSIATDEKSATFATEVYTSEDIKKANVKDVYDFLSSQTSIITIPNSGNPFTQKIDLRGYGITDGYENVVVTVNGRRLNNIDLVPQFLQSVSLDSIERIEILKGSGSVEFGDGAQAGAINIVTKAKYDNFIETSFGTNNTKNGTVSLGHSTDKFIFNALIDYSSTDGQKNDENYIRNKNFGITYFPTNDLEVYIKKDFSNSNVEYANSVSLAEYNNNINIDNGESEQYFESYVTTVGFLYNLSKDYEVEVSLSDEDKKSEYPTWKSKYETQELNAKLKISKDTYKAVIGVNALNANRKNPSGDETSKDNKSAFVTTTYSLDKDLAISAGVRNETVDYTHKPNAGVAISSEHNLTALDLGINYKLDDQGSIFANFNKGYQSPNIDRFFSAGTFNSFIEPSKVKTISVGYNRFTKDNKLKISIFRSNLENEIYLYKDGGGFTNTNFDKTHKYGLELFDRYQINDNYFASINYNYLIAKIDEDSRESGAYNGKDLPGVSKHNVVLSLGYSINSFSSTLSHTYRSEAYNAEDFKNEDAQKQQAYHSTDLTGTYKYKDTEFFGKIQNIFDKKNGFWVRDDAIYPYNYYRSVLVGVKVYF